MIQGPDIFGVKDVREMVAAIPLTDARFAIREQNMNLPYHIGRGMSEQEKRDFGNWLAGFVDGEGCFFLRMRCDRGYQRCDAAFRIELRADDLSVLKKIRKYLGCGSIKEKRLPSINSTANSRPQSSYRVCNVTDLATIIVPMFELCPLHAKKANDFLVWKEAVYLLHKLKMRKIRSNGGRFFTKWTDEEFNRFSKLVADLKGVRAYTETGLKETPTYKKSVVTIKPLF